MNLKVLTELEKVLKINKAILKKKNGSLTDKTFSYWKIKKL